MELRGLEPGDGEAIREIARRSLTASYDDVLLAGVIEEALSRWYDDDALTEYLGGDEMLFTIAEVDDSPVGFVQSHVLEDIDKGRILWIHVDPAHRGKGIGASLLDHAREQLHGRGIDAVTAVVLAAHEGGLAFYELHDFEPLTERTVTIGDEEYGEVILRESGVEAAPLELRSLSDGRELFIDFEDSDRGSEAPFCAVYRDPQRERRWGWFCTSCESFATNMDTMGRIQCADCGNTRKPTRWDASYL